MIKILQKNKNYKVTNWDKFPISFGIFPDILLEYKSLENVDDKYKIINKK